MVGQGRGPLVPHGRRHPLDRVGLAEQGVNRLSVVRRLLQDDQQLAHLVEMFPGFGKE